MSSEKHFSLPERQKYFPASSPLHTADTSSLARFPFSPLPERPRKPRSDGAPLFLPSCGGFMFVMTAPFGSCETHKLTWLQSCQPWSYLRLVAYSFVGLCEGAQQPVV